MNWDKRTATLSFHGSKEATPDDLETNAKVHQRNIDWNIAITRLRYDTTCRKVGS